MGLLRSLPPAATERLSELTLLLPELPGGDYSFSEVGIHPSTGKGFTPLLLLL